MEEEETSQYSPYTGGHLPAAWGKLEANKGQGSGVQEKDEEYYLYIKLVKKTIPSAFTLEGSNHVRFLISLRSWKSKPLLPLWLLYHPQLHAHARPPT